MLYFVSGKLRSGQLMQAPHEEFVQMTKRLIQPSLEMLLEMQQKGEVLAGGVPAASQAVMFILRLSGASSHLAVRQRLFQLPIFNLFEWTVTPLESFEEWRSLVKE